MISSQRQNLVESGIELALRRMLFCGVDQPHRLEELTQKVRLQAGERLVRLTLATICGSDLHTTEGRRPAHLPSVLGHEGVGVVEAVGSAEDADLIQRRVTWTLADSCGHCPACTAWALPQKCDELFKYGHAPLGEHGGMNGCFASHILLRAGTTVVPIPDELPDAAVVPANCALATMVAVIEPIPALARTALIQGAGLLGLYGAALLKERGVDRVLVADTVPERLELVKKVGAEAILVADLPALPKQSIDAVIEVAGVPQVLAEGLRVLRPGGTYVLAGMVHDHTKLEIKGVDLVKGCVTMIGVHNYGPRHLEESIAFLQRQKDRFPWAELVSPPLPLERIDEAFDLTRSRKWLRVAVKND